jgi:hypothetical protein
MAPGGSPIRRTSFDVNTTIGRLFALTMPILRMEICQSLSISRSSASNFVAYLSISSISRTQGTSCRGARNSGPSWKDSNVWRSRRRDAHSVAEELPRVFRKRRCSDLSNYPIASSSLSPS